MKIKICSLSDLEPGSSQEFTTSLGRIAVFRSRKNQLFATAARCPHKGGPIVHAIFDGECNVTCPLHGYTFNVKNGSCTDPALERKLKTFQVSIEKQDIYVAPAEKEASIASI